MSAKTKARTAKPEPPRAQDLTSAEKRAILESAECGQCGAPAGEHCKTAGGHSVPQVHGARYQAAQGKVRW